MVVSGPQDFDNSVFYMQHSLIIWPNLWLRRHVVVEEAFTCLRDTWGGQPVKHFEIQSRKTKAMLLAVFFVHNHLYMFRGWTASALFPIVADNSPPIKVNQ